MSLSTWGADFAYGEEDPGVRPGSAPAMAGGVPDVSWACPAVRHADLGDAGRVQRLVRIVASAGPNPEKSIPGVFANNAHAAKAAKGGAAPAEAAGRSRSGMGAARGAASAGDGTTASRAGCGARAGVSIWRPAALAGGCGAAFPGPSGTGAGAASCPGPAFIRS